MYAIVEVSGMQCKVTGKETIRVPKLEIEPGKSLVLDRVLLVVDKDNVKVGKPLVSNAKIQATVVAHKKSPKIKVFKKKRRKNYQVLRGHRQEYTEIRIDSIGVGSDKAAATANADQKKPATAKPKSNEPAAKPKAEKKTSAQALAEQKTEATKPKATVKKSITPQREAKG